MSITKSNSPFEQESTTHDVINLNDIKNKILHDPQILAIIIGSFVLLFFLIFLLINKCCCRTANKKSPQIRWKYKIIRERNPRFRFFSVDSQDDRSESHNYPSTSFSDDSYSHPSFQRRERYPTQRKRLPKIKLLSPLPIMQVRPAQPPPIQPSIRISPPPPQPVPPPVPPVLPIRLHSPTNVLENIRPSQEPPDYNINESIV